MTDPHFRRSLGHTRSARGVTLVECAVSLVIVSLAVAVVLQTDIGTVETAQHASNSQLAALLANEIMAYETMGEMPQEAAAVIQIGPMPVDPYDERFVDTETRYFPYGDFEYEVTKQIVEIRDDTDMSLSSEERDPPVYGAVPAEEDEEQLAIEVVHIRVVVRYPAPSGRGSTTAANGREMDEVAMETYVFDMVRRDQAAEAPENEQE